MHKKKHQVHLSAFFYAFTSFKAELWGCRAAESSRDRDASPYPFYSLQIAYLFDITDVGLTSDYLWLI